MPRSDSLRETVPLCTWAHCFVGLDQQNAPSRRGLPGVELKHLSRWIANGFAVAVADFEGLDGHGLSPFPDPDGIAADILAICPAAREFDERIGNGVIAGGFCQGAAAVLRLPGISHPYSEVDLRGIVSLAPPDYPSYFTMVTRDPDFPADALALVLLAGLRAADDGFDPGARLTDTGMALLDEIPPLSVPEMRRLLEPFTVRDLGLYDLTGEPRVAEFLEQCDALPENDGTPIFLASVDSDPLTPEASIRRCADQLSARGAEVATTRYAGDHMGILSSAASEAVEWAVRAAR
ncbi:hypothetical protein [Nocardia mexicana]|uniref:Uncharacterized protein n=1 Tax=Nocardia mexicana TaxID=279262 RepID=A0A370H851_9NOCA|nr:hypothetical protein [Nocardia mexicana]RDI52838.1 hypothetical protein DFR68_103225 [Nocardia mexicana]